MKPVKCPHNQERNQCLICTPMRFHFIEKPWYTGEPIFEGTDKYNQIEEGIKNATNKS